MSNRGGCMKHPRTPVFGCPDCIEKKGRSYEMKEPSVKTKFDMLARAFDLHSQAVSETKPKSMANDVLYCRRRMTLLLEQVDLMTELFTELEDSL